MSPSLAFGSAHSFQSSSVHICVGLNLSRTAATEDVNTKDSSLGPACLKAEFRMPRLPWTAGVMASSHVVLFELMGEAVWITAVTPVLMLVEVKCKLTIKLRRERLINYHEIEYDVK